MLEKLRTKKFIPNLVIIMVIIISTFIIMTVMIFDKSFNTKTKNKNYEFGETVIYENDSIKIYIKNKNKW